MNISNAKRIQKLFGNLITNPDLIVPYLSKSVFGRRLPIDYGLPWWSFRAIEYADKIFPGTKVFEFGTGGSTLRYAKVCKEITCVEDDLNWLNIVRLRLSENGLINKVYLIHEAFDFKHPVDFKKSSYLKSYDADKAYDVVIIDGQDESFHERIECFKFVEPTIKKGGVIIVDDWWRYTELLEFNRSKNVKIFESVGPCRYGVTSTAFFHY